MNLNQTKSDFYDEIAIKRNKQMVEKEMEYNNYKFPPYNQIILVG